jgi:phage gp29-like protein
LKIGPVTLSLGSKPAPKATLGELGATGTQIFGGFVGQQDYNAQLQSPHSYDEYDKMRNDGQVRAALTAVKMPLLNAEWRIESASDGAEDRKIAGIIERGLMEEMSNSWRDFMRHALLMLDYGSIPFEKVWEIRDGLVMIRKLAPRMPRTIQFWQVDEHGGLSGIRQNTSTGTGFITVDIPVEKLIVFVNDLEGSNWRGTSLLRSAWKHHFFKDGLYRVQAIALEKRAVGVDVGTLKGEDITEERQRMMERALMTLHAHEKQFFTEVEGQSAYRLETGTGNALDPMAAIEHHDLRILRSILAEFIGMGAGSTGSLAMHKDKSAFFLLALGGIANNLADSISNHLIRQWVDYNWVVKDYPRLQYTRLEARDILIYADAVLKLTQAGVLTPGPDIERESRALLDLPHPMGAVDPPVDVNTPPPAKATQTNSRQIEKLLDVGLSMFERGDLEAVADVSVPFRQQLAEELGASDPRSAKARASLACSRLKSAFVEDMMRQINREEFDKESLRGALVGAARKGNR